MAWGGIVGYFMWIAACYPQIYVLALIRLLELENSVLGQHGPARAFSP